jgi:hypothetical protein
VVVVIAAYSYAVMAFGFLVALWTGISAGRHRPTGEIQMVLVIVLEAALVAQTVIGLVRLGGAGLTEPVTCIAYSIGILVPMPGAFQLARLERTRWGSIIVCFASVVVAVMTLRLAQIWGLIGGHEGV